MAYRFLNKNPLNRNRGDCTVRAICTVLGEDWYNVYIGLCIQGYELADMPDSNEVWGEYLHSRGFKRYALPDTCPYCYTVEDFCNDYPQGKYILATGTHAIAIIDGNYYDSFDSGHYVPISYWVKE